jgi:hypothetical protein
MSIVKLNNRSVKDITAFGSISSLGSLTHIATQTASSSASLSFTSGIDSTYKEYIFYFVNIHPATNGVDFHFNGSIDGGSNYNVVKTTTFFNASHYESDISTEFAYKTGDDLAQSTSYQSLTRTNLGNDNDQSFSGMMHLFNPSSTTFVKHFIAVDNHSHGTDLSLNDYVAGYFNTTSAINSMDFKMSSGNIDSGQILLFGLN